MNLSPTNELRSFAQRLDRLGLRSFGMNVVRGDGQLIRPDLPKLGFPFPLRLSLRDVILTKDVES